MVTDGSGFIAAWVAGFACGFAMRQHSTGVDKQNSDRTAEFAENLGELLAAISLLVFGAVLLGPGLEHLSWRIVLYAVLGLTVVRMPPVALSLAGSGLRLRLPTVAYIGWFGPCGPASVVLALLVVEDPVPGVELLGNVVAITVGLSVLLHGVSAVSLAERYGHWHEKATAASLLAVGGRGTVATSPVTRVTWWVAEGLAGAVGLARAACAGACGTTSAEAGRGTAVAAAISSRRLRRKAEGRGGGSMAWVCRPGNAVVNVP
ncbi:MULTISPECIES: hypothetical protein [Streptomyces]|uniref:hypothetical protein n=1 Tax=Streptomyces TaxID=1883 RepID=UPI0012FF2BBF|nr:MULTISPECIES: hypothetical protein [Streptomyces]